MKRRIFICTIAAFLSIFSLIAALNLTDRATVVSGDVSAKCSLQDSWRFRVALFPEEIHIVGLACSVSEKFSIKMGGLTYCLATDDCDSVYIPELNLYYSVSPDNHKKLHNLFAEYDLPQR